MTGVTFTGDIARMLPLEALMLRSKVPGARLEFLSKVARRKLMGYELSGWREMPTFPEKKRRMRSVPVAPGGPIMVCLDTSWSMEGARESLAKAVVLEGVRAAHQQGRTCFVSAFSSKNNVMDCGELSPDKQGIIRLLDFLGGSFSGGTDVTGALRHAMDQLTSDDVARACDILLVTDGELPNPPIGPRDKERLDVLKVELGATVHGLLVGKPSSEPLEQLCSQVHTFLNRLDPAASLGFEGGGGESAFRGLAAGAVSRGGSAAVFGMNREGAFRSQPRYSLLLPARCRNRAGGLCAGVGAWGGGGWVGGGREGARRCGEVGLRGKGGKKKKGKGKRWEDDDDEDMDVGDDGGDDLEMETGFEAVYEEEEVGGQKYVAGSLGEAWEGEVVKILEEAAQKAQDGIFDASGEVRKEDGEDQGVSKGQQEDMEVIESVLREVETGLIERGTEARLLVLAAMCREHLLLVGPPGTAKSALARRLAGLCGGSFFERLLTRFTTPEELFGPLSLMELEKDRYLRLTDGYLPSASVAFLDEVFKSSSAVLNTLLTVLNERRFDNGDARVSIPLLCAVGASNEMPEGDELDALSDRFLLRREVKPVSDEGLDQLLSPSLLPSPEIHRPDGDGCVLLDPLVERLHEDGGVVDGVQLGGDCMTLLRGLRGFLKDECDEQLSDRRLVKSSRLLRVSAATHGRTEVSATDCLLLEHTLWNLPETRPRLRDYLWDTVVPDAGARQALFVLEGLYSRACETLERTSGCVTEAEGARVGDVRELEGIRKECDILAGVVLGRGKAMAKHAEGLGRAGEHLWLDAQEAAAAKQELAPVAQSRAEELQRALACVHALSKAITDESIASEDRRDIVDTLLDDALGQRQDTGQFTEKELDLSMKEAKVRFSKEDFRRWKKASKARDRD